MAGICAAMYDPAARGYLVDATKSKGRGEAFGLYGAAQMAGFLLGPALGALAAAVTGRSESVFVLGGVSIAVAALVVAVGVHEQPHGARTTAVPAQGLTELNREAPASEGRAAAASADEADGGSNPSGLSGRTPVTSLLNRCFLAAIVLNFGFFFAGGTWEVIWSLFMEARGASIQYIGFTFALFSLPVLVLSPVVGRLVDRRGPLPFIAFGMLLAIVTGIAYTLAFDLLLIAAIVIVEATGWALVNPALYALVAAGSPAGRSSTAQGVFGTSGTLAYIASSLLAGQAFATDLRYPFYLLVTVVGVTLVLAMLIVDRERVAPERPTATVTARPRPDPRAADG
jgi:MFS family permease